MANRACGTCEFWVDRKDTTGLGECKRYPVQPPKQIVMAQSNWCGEWKERA